MVGGTLFAAPTNLTNVNGTLFFSGNDGIHGTELWKSNGAAAGTALVSDILPGPNGSYPTALTNVSNSLFFVADDGVHGEELFVSSPNAAGARLVQDINPGAGQSYPKSLTNVSDTLFFSAADGVHGRELWRSNGAPAGTFLVKDIAPQANSCAQPLRIVYQCKRHSVFSGLRWRQRRGALEKQRHTQRHRTGLGH